MLKHSILKSNIILQTIDIQYFKSINDIGEILWNNAAPPDNLFLQYDYLAMLERIPPEGMSFAYCLFFDESQALGVAYFQIKGFDAAASIRSYIEKGKLPSFAESIAKPLNFNTLVSGNLLLTGEHGFYFQPQMPEDLRAKKMTEAIEIVSENIAKEGRGASLNFVKDYTENQAHFAVLQCGEYDFLPNMMLAIRKNWITFDDYLNDMTTKYRTRAKRAFKKMDGLVKLELDEMLLKRHQQDIYDLYLKIARNVGFNLFELHRDYFCEMKRIFGEKYEVWGVFDNNKMVGFYTTLHNYNELETGFIGFEENYNPTHQLYLNCLYDMVRQGIEKGVHRIVFARTAMEIKSSIGAEPHKMHTYIRHKSSIINFALPKIVRLLSPPMEWVQRKPFKED